MRLWFLINVDQGAILKQVGFGEKKISGRFICDI